MTDLPRGTVTFLFTDIEGSTALWERDRAAMREAVDRQLAILHSLISAHHGVHFKTIGDGTQAAFGTAEDALRAALASQRALLAEDWGELGPIRVRMALHAGEAQPDAHGDYLTAPLNRLARLLSTGSGGQILLSQTVQQLTRGVLPPAVELRDLGEHRLRDLLEPEHVFQLVHPDLPADFPPLRSMDARPQNLPRQPTPFLGREQQVADVVELLRRADTQLLTLVGPGGTGKTRLALQVAAEVLEDFADGVFFVPLAMLTDPALVPSAIAATLGLREEGEQSMAGRLQDVVLVREMLLVLDNFEHLVDGGSAVWSLLGSAPRVKVLATSRVPLHLRAEREYPVPPLGLPRRTPPPTLEQLSQYEAVRLFIDRAQAVNPDFVVDNDNAPAVAEICWRLDGLPLAIELAAARVRLLPPQAILARLEHRLPFLTGGARDAPERQRTLRNTVAWSYDLLELEEQQVFRQLAVFAGGMTLEPAEAVANPHGRLDIFGNLEPLVEHNLLRQEAGLEGEPRFSMLETIREYGLEQLEASGEADATRARHAAVVLALAEEADGALHGPQQLIWIERLETEYANIRSALGWTLTGQPETALGLVAALHWFWFYRGYLTEGRDWTERVLATGASAAPEVRARVLNWSSKFALYGQADYATATARAEEALALARSVGDRSSEGWALQNLGAVAAERGDVKRAAALSAEAEAQFRGIGERHGVAVALFNQAGLVGAAGDVNRQRELLERSLAEYRATGDRVEASWALFALGDHELDQGHVDRARALLEEALETAREFGFGLVEGGALLELAEVAGEQGDANQAATYLQDAETKFRELGHGLIVADGLNHSGYQALRQGDHERARRLVEEALAVARESGALSEVARFVCNLGDVLPCPRAGDRRQHNDHHLPAGAGRSRNGHRTSPGGIAPLRCRRDAPGNGGHPALAL
ncbi:MAG: hypothetical protein K0S14_2118 [Thermomicrobiales bacterium]|nr:hypothetical protein [Thermomicrobiales bacterium]